MRPYEAYMGCIENHYGPVSTGLKENYNYAKPENDQIKLLTNALFD